MKKLIMAILLSIAVPAIAQAKPATCQIEDSGKPYIRVSVILIHKVTAAFILATLVLLKN